MCIVTQNGPALRKDSCTRIQFSAFTQECEMLSENKTWSSSLVEVLRLGIDVSEEPTVPFIIRLL